MCVCMYTMCVTGASRSEKDIGYPGTGVRDICEPLCWCWDLLQEQQMLLATEPPFQPSKDSCWGLVWCYAFKC